MRRLVVMAVPRRHTFACSAPLVDVHISSRSNVPIQEGHNLTVEACRIGGEIDPMCSVRVKVRLDNLCLRKGGSLLPNVVVRGRAVATALQQVVLARRDHDGLREGPSLEVQPSGAQEL